MSELRESDPFASAPATELAPQYGAGPVFTAMYPGDCSECFGEVQDEPCRMWNGEIIHDSCYRASMGATS